jgi:hypothetical protein
MIEDFKEIWLTDTTLTICLIILLVCCVFLLGLGIWTITYDWYEPK